MNLTSRLKPPMWRERRRVPDTIAVPLVRFASLPIIALVSLTNTHLVVTQAGSSLYGVVNTIATLGALIPIADLGVGAAVNTAVAIGTAPGGSVDIIAPTLRAAVRRLLVAFGVCTAALIAMAVFQVWGRILNSPLSYGDGWLTSFALVLFLATMMFSVGVRVLLGAGAAMVATLVGLSANVFALLSTLLFIVTGAPVLLYASSGYIGLLTSAVISSALAVRKLRRESNIRLRDILEAVHQPDLLAGSRYSLLMLISFPAAMESGRLIVSHLASPQDLSKFALAAQFYAMAWSVFAAFGAVLWRQFVQLREQPLEGYALWRKSMLQIGSLGAVAAVGMVALGPLAAALISGGQANAGVDIFLGLALLLLAQVLHLPGSVMFTTPADLKWQSRWMVAMAILAVVGAFLLVPFIGPAGVSASAGFAVVVCQILPDLGRARRLRGTHSSVQVGVRVEA